jgi:hypothetical protein
MVVVVVVVVAASTMVARKERVERRGLGWVGCV